MKLALVLAASFVLLGCPSKSSSQSSSTGSAMPLGNAAGAGPLANLEAAPFINEVWISQEGQQMPFIYYARENVRVSAQCRNAVGQLNCDAVRQLRNAPPTDVQKRTLTGNISAGTRVCMKLGRQIVSGHNAQGNEDGFCRFNDGSLASTGALEQYNMRVTE